MHPTGAGLLILVVLTAAGCGDAGSTPDVPGITCNDGYVAHPSYTEDRDGCGPHGGVVDPFRDEFGSYLDDLPAGRPTAYLCHDEWRSTAIGNQGACSSHGGVAHAVFPDGSQMSVDGPQKGTIVNPDGSTIGPFGPD